MKDATGAIFGDSGSMFVNVDATYRVFSPRPGQSLLGVVRADILIEINHTTVFDSISRTILKI